MNIRERIDGLLKERDWTMYRLAQEADIPQSTLSNIFNRQNEPTVSTIEIICKGFGITMSEFFAQDGDELLPLSQEQRNMLKDWGKLDKIQKKKLAEFLEVL